MDAFLAPIRLFVTHPERIATVAAALFAAAVAIYVAKRLVAWPLVVAAISWCAFAGWEHYCNIQQYNIRVDLFLIWPVLLIVTTLGLLGAFLAPRRFSLRTLLIVMTVIAAMLGALAYSVR